MAKKNEKFCGQTDCVIHGFCKRFNTDLKDIDRVDGLFVDGWCDTFKGDEATEKTARTYVSGLAPEALKPKAQAQKPVEVSPKQNPFPVSTTKIEDRIVPVGLTDAELLEKAAKAGDLNQKIIAAETEKKAFNDDINSKLKSMKGTLNDLLVELENKKEMRNLPCTVSYDLDNRKIVYFHNLQRVDERDMTEDDDQLELVE